MIATLESLEIGTPGSKKVRGGSQGSTANQLFDTPMGTPQGPLRHDYDDTAYVDVALDATSNWNTACVDAAFSTIPVYTVNPAQRPLRVETLEQR